MLEGLEHLIGAEREHGGTTSTGDVPERVGEKGFPDADGADDGDVRMGIKKAQGGELIEQRAIEGDLGRGVPVFEAHGRIQVRLLDPEGDAEALAAGDFVAEGEQQQILMRHFLLSREGEPLGQGIEHA